MFQNRENPKRITIKISFSFDENGTLPEPHFLQAMTHLIRLKKETHTALFINKGVSPLITHRSIIIQREK